VVTGTLELPRVGEDLLARLRGTRAFVLNAAEAAAVTGRAEPAAAAAWLASRGTTAVVTLGPGGAIAAEGDHIERWTAPPVDAFDATGAGDLFAAAYVWADLGGASLRERLSWACLYASLSVRSPTAFDGAVARDVLLTAGRQAGLQPPPGARTP
jgi:sugar/nucleoside kinase (ribokinase family)